MSAEHRPNRPHRTEQAKRRNEERNKRLSSTLKDNLNKRKRQARARADDNKARARADDHKTRARADDNKARDGQAPDRTD